MHDEFVGEPSHELHSQKGYAQNGDP